MRSQTRTDHVNQVKAHLGSGRWRPPTWRRSGTGWRPRRWSRTVLSCCSAWSASACSSCAWCVPGWAWSSSPWSGRTGGGPQGDSGPGGPPGHPRAVPVARRAHGGFCAYLGCTPKSPAPPWRPPQERQHAPGSAPVVLAEKETYEHLRRSSDRTLAAGLCPRDRRYPDAPVGPFVRRRFPARAGIHQLGGAVRAVLPSGAACPAGPALLHSARETGWPPGAPGRGHRSWTPRAGRAPAKARGPGTVPAVACMQRLRLVRASPRARRPASGTRRGVCRGEQLPDRVDGPAAVLPARVALPLLGGKLELRRIQRRRRRTPQLPRPGGLPALRVDAGQPHGHLPDRLPLGARLLGDELDGRRLARSEGAVMTGTARAAERADTELTVFTGSRPSHVGDLQHLESAGILPVPESGRYGTGRACSRRGCLRTWRSAPCSSGRWGRCSACPPPWAWRRSAWASCWGPCRSRTCPRGGRWPARDRCRSRGCRSARASSCPAYPGLVGDRVDRDRRAVRRAGCHLLSTSRSGSRRYWWWPRRWRSASAATRLRSRRRIRGDDHAGPVRHPDRPVDLLRHLTLAHSTVHGGTLAGRFILMVTIAASGSFSWASYGSDYSRYLPERSSRAGAFWWTFAGLAVAFAWLGEIGVVAASVLGSQTAAGSAPDGRRAPRRRRPGRDRVCRGRLQRAQRLQRSLAFQSVSIRVKRPLLSRWPALPLSAWWCGWTPARRPQRGSRICCCWRRTGAPRSPRSSWSTGGSAGPLQSRIRAGGDHLGEARAGWPAVIAFAAGCAAMVPLMSTYYMAGPAARAMDGADISYIVGIVVAGGLYLWLRR